VKDEVIVEAYEWPTPTPLYLQLRNTGVRTLDLTKANYYVGGLLMTNTHRNDLYSNHFFARDVMYRKRPHSRFDTCIRSRIRRKDQSF